MLLLKQTIDKIYLLNLFVICGFLGNFSRHKVKLNPLFLAMFDGQNIVTSYSRFTLRFCKLCRFQIMLWLGCQLNFQDYCKLRRFGKIDGFVQAFLRI